MPLITRKICLIGDFAVGKTSLVRRFVYALFDDKYLSTIGVKVSRKTLVMSLVGKTAQEEAVVEMTLMLWDLAGSEEFGRVRSSYLRGAAGAILVYDLTRPETIEHLRTYAQDLRQSSPEAQMILAANKCDLADSTTAAWIQAQAVAVQLNAPCYLTSAKTGMNVEVLFDHLGRLLV